MYKINNTYIKITNLLTTIENVSIFPCPTTLRWTSTTSSYWRDHLNQTSCLQTHILAQSKFIYIKDLESLYAEIPYTLKLTLPETYPEKPPFIAFLDKVHHLNIHPNTGQLSMPMLTEDWSPFLNLKAVINSLDEIL